MDTKFREKLEDIDCMLSVVKMATMGEGGSVVLGEKEQVGINLIIEKIQEEIRIIDK